MLVRRAMNAIVFQMKRAHLAASKAGRYLLSVVPDMTPARFDVMLLLRNMGRLNARTKKWAHVRLNHCFAEQRRMVVELGLHKSSVAEMLDRLEGLQWITRSVDIDDGRVRLVSMTALGLERLAAACKILFRWKIMRPQLDAIIQGLEPDRPFNEAFERVWTAIARIGRLFGDTATFDFYDRQLGFKVPEHTALEYQTGRLFGCEAGTRVPDFVLLFLYRWEQRGKKCVDGYRIPHPSCRT